MSLGARWPRPPSTRRGTMANAEVAATPPRNRRRPVFFFMSLTSSSERLEARVDQALRARVGLARPLPLHGEVTAIAGGLRDRERLLDVDAVYRLPVDLGILDVADAVRVLEHRLQGLVVVVLTLAEEHRVAEVREGPEPRVRRPRDHVHHEEGVLRLGVVVLQVDHHPLRGPVLGDLAQAP